ncbi:ABC transporter permease [Catelliglobosispora koreensis]|uniref:ABC transporter permease n=1 Tax=Catelliglobosispora koreensis TaxID=129052 RepID=UPI00036711D2|nr:ABC transporter permease [Catelliglobosispora koreensis]
MNATLIRTEFKLYLRDISSVFLGIVMSPMILAILGSIPSFRAPDPALGGRSVIALYVPILLGVTITMVGLTTMPIPIATYRERGILKRFATTPARPGDVLMSQALVQLAILFTGSLLVLGIGRAAFGVSVPRNLGAFVVAFILCCAASFGIGLVLASLRSSKVAQGIGTVLFFPLMFFGGLWVPREVMPETIRGISDFTPLGAGVQAMQDASAGSWPQWLHLGVLAGYGIIAWLVAKKLFRWT